MSKQTINGILRTDLGYQGVVITDDLQMGAIAQKYGLQDTLKLSINAGVDILLFGNQLNPNAVVTTKTLVEHIKRLVENHEVRRGQIDNAYRRIQKLKQHLQPRYDTQRMN